MTDDKEAELRGAMIMADEEVQEAATEAAACEATGANAHVRAYWEHQELQTQRKLRREAGAVLIAGSLLAYKLWPSVLVSQPLTQITLGELLRGVGTLALGLVTLRIVLWLWFLHE